ncbi:proopiomelanocortin a [Clinocottus analis]|uniref:proopiomelanocortin a n=1 Tax=Clinocottus analis TaxID=304258 RepID=UPI0035C1C8B0
MSPAWLLVALAVVGVARGDGQCWEHPSCQDINSETSMMECIQFCHSDLTAEVPAIPGAAHLQPAPPPSDPESLLPLSLLLPLSSSSSSSSSSFPSSPQTKRSYSMEHFRWGKPVGRKRRPVKVYASNGVEEESAELFPGEMRRRELAAAAAAKMMMAGAGNEAKEATEEELEEEEEQQRRLLGGDAHEKKDGTYKMKHFRWSGPPASKRYGGFMKSWDERSQRPLLTLFKNVINKDGQQQEGEQ